jgi:hypothetical protein
MATSGELKELLRKLPPRPWKVTIVPPSQFQRAGYTAGPDDPDGVGPQTGFEVGTIRSAQGANVVEPWPESASMIIAIPGVLKALVDLVNGVETLEVSE